MAWAINRITAVLAGGIRQHVTCGWAEFGWLRLTPLPLPVVPSRGVLRGVTDSLGSRSARRQGQDAPESDFHGVKWMIDSSPAGKRERGGTAQHPEAGSPSREVEGRGEVACYRGKAWISPSPSWILKLQTPGALWIYAFADRSGPDIEIKAAVEL